MKTRIVSSVLFKFVYAMIEGTDIVIFRNLQISFFSPEKVNLRITTTGNVWKYLPKTELPEIAKWNKALDFREQQV
jgi:hypothetical protein